MDAAFHLLGAAFGLWQTIEDREDILLDSLDPGRVAADYAIEPQLLGLGS